MSVNCMHEIRANQTAVSVHLSELAKTNINYNTESCIFTRYVYFLYLVPYDIAGGETILIISI